MENSNDLHNVVRHTVIDGVSSGGENGSEVGTLYR